MKTGCIINATGVWADQLQPPPDKGLRIRPLRGSHLVVPASRLPLKFAMNVLHPRDRRPMMLVPFFDTLLVGTTDLDHEADLADEPRISPAEVNYLVEAVDFLFPDLGFSAGDCQASFAGVRSVLSRGDKPPSGESREHAVWGERGLFTVTGGKLTTFRQLAWDVLHKARRFLPAVTTQSRQQPVLRGEEDQRCPTEMDPRRFRTLTGRHGQKASQILEGASSPDLQPVGDTPVLWAELPHMAADEMVRHLDDLLLRRSRIGLLEPDGGERHLERIGRLCMPGLGWDSKRWDKEQRAYLTLWRKCYGPPAGAHKEVDP